MKNLHDGLFCGTLVLDNFENRMGVELRIIGRKYKKMAGIILAHHAVM